MQHGLVAAQDNTTHTKKTITERVKFLQINVGRRNVTYDLIYRKAMQAGADLILISEPNKKTDAETWLWCSSAIKCRLINAAKVKDMYGLS